MLRFKKETDSERIERLRHTIIDQYTESNKANEMLISEADLVFMLEKAHEQIVNDINREQQALSEEPLEEPSPEANFGDNIMPFDE